MSRRIALFALLLLLPVTVLIAQRRTVTRVAIVARPRSYNGPCPATLTFTATIFVSHPSFVEYEWIRSDGARGPRQRIEIRSAGQGVTDTWQIGGARMRTVVWEQLHVLAPTGISSPRQRVAVRCR